MRGTTKDARQVIFGARSWLGADRESVEEEEPHVRMWDGLTRAALELDRLAALERGVRELADELRLESNQSYERWCHRGLPYDKGRSDQAEDDKSHLRALLNPSVSHEAEENDHE